MKDNREKVKLMNEFNPLVIDYPYCWKPPKKEEKTKKPTIQLININDQKDYWN